MKKLKVGMLLSALTFVGAVAHAKLSDIQSMKCIDGDSQTRSAFQDIQAAYEMRLVTAKDFFKVMEKPDNCPQLRKDLKKLHTSAIASFPRAKVAPRMESGFSGQNSGFGPSPAPSLHGGGMPPAPDFGDFPPPPPSPPMPDSDFSDDFSDFR